MYISKYVCTMIMTGNLAFFFLTFARRSSCIRFVFIWAIVKKQKNVIVSLFLFGDGLVGRLIFFKFMMVLYIDLYIVFIVLITDGRQKKQELKTFAFLRRSRS